MAQAPSRSVLAHSVLTRYLPNLRSIHTTASYVSVYRGAFDHNDSFTWTRSGIEGSLFLCVSSTPDTAPTYHIIILNRTGPNNFVWTLTAPEGLEFGQEIHIVLHSDCGHLASALPQTAENKEDLPNERLCYGLWVWADNGKSGDDGDRLGQAVLECATAAQQTSVAQADELGGRSILGQIFPERQQQENQPPLQYAPPSQNGIGGQDVLGKLFSSAARQRSVGY